MLLAEWRNPLSAELDGDPEAFRLMSRSPVPVVLAHGEMEHFERVVVIARNGDASPSENQDLGIAAEVATRLGHQHGHRIACVGSGVPGSLFAPKLHVDCVESADAIAWARDNATASDVMVFPGLDAVRDALERIPQLTDKRFMVAIATHGAPFQGVPVERGGGLIVGRSMTESRT
jgi:hypothetical protein